MKTKTLRQIITYIATACCAQMLLVAQQSDQAQGQPGQRKNTSGQTSDPSKDGIRLSKLKGANVKSKNGEDLGKLDDIVLDRQTGQIKFAIVGKGGVLGVGEKSHPVPWQEVRIDSEKQVTLNVDKQKLQSAPTVTSDYQELNDPDAVLVIYRFYEIQPAGAAETPGGTQQGTGKSQTDPNKSNP